MPSSKTHIYLLDPENHLINLPTELSKACLALVEQIVFLDNKHSNY